jgi:propionyl-CoA synthetase
VRVLGEGGEELPRGTSGHLALKLPLPPGCATTLWENDEGFAQGYLSRFPGFYQTADGGFIDEDGYVWVMGRTDDVINVAGHRLGTREIEEAIQAHTAIAEVAVVGVADELKGQMPMAFAVVKDASVVDSAEKRAALEKEVMKTVDNLLGAIARPGRVHFISGLPKTRSGKMLRRSIQALAEGRDPGDLTTIDDPSTLDQIRSSLAR